ncbi:OmpA family protein [Flavobacterium sp. TR2]|uniref:OmpA family protein n=1 Tax=Flavobacterium sp. TR2 TaxID=2977321 RepID=UPI0021B09963|nr:OmpA family protein [Flavobacterium sp. TR2]UWY27726.1 OmpA family protein [Flavobacterium sp. TR2]
MKKSIKYLAVAFLFAYGSYGQQNQMKKGNNDYEKCAYVDAVKVYEKVFERGYKSADMLKKLGNAYYFQADYANAAKWYGELFALPDSKEAEYYYRYAQSLKATMNYAKADEVLKEFSKMDKQDSRAVMAMDQKNYLDAIKKNSGKFTVKDAGINSDKSDYGSAVLGKKIIFASARGNNKMNEWNGENCTDLYEADLKDDGSFGTPSKFGGDLNTKYNESTPVFTKDGQTVYFTRNNYMNGKKRMNKQNIILLKLYKATKVGDKWGNVKELPFNSNDYSVAHPALSPDEKTLYFVSNMPGTLGDSDIFKVSINGNDMYGTPVNLGSGINTKGRESFPYVTDANEIYFASDGHPGLGGLDIFSGSIDSKGAVSNIQNLGADINSAQDDFAYIINTVTGKGYFSSNKVGGKGSDDIYSFEKKKCTQELNGVITDAETGIILPGAKVSLFEMNDLSLKNSMLADASGKYNFTVDCGKHYNVRAEKPEYTTKEVAIAIPEISGKTSLSLSISLEKSKCRVVVGDDLGKCFNIKNIYFDLDKSNIRAEAALDLEKILVVMNENPTMELDIRSHTDCRASKAYNMALSDRRAKSTIQWLIKNGIAPNRLTGRGYGESKLVNHCECEGKVATPCTEEEHQANRRSEFIITKI